MSLFEIRLTPDAHEDIARLSPTDQTRILDRLAWLGENAGAVPHRPLHGPSWSGLYRYRVGDYRIIYRIDRANLLLTVLKVGHRRDVYR